MNVVAPPQFLIFHSQFLIFIFPYLRPMNITSLQPTALWQHFAALNAVPRPSKKEQRVIEFAKQFGESLGLPTMVDEAGNVIISKPATKGMEDRPALVLQSHLDMVHQKNAGTEFDFDTQGIEMYVDGDWVKARGTTLGADNGIGVAAIMAVLASTDIPHPAVQALFTIDEETGMTGALALKGGILKGNILLNLDTEEDTELTIGCAGGVDITATANYTASTPKNNLALRISISGLTGGHSGMDIHKGRGNANKLLNRALYAIAKHSPLELASFEGGSLRNAIPREANAVVVIPAEFETKAKQLCTDLAAAITKELGTTDPAFKFTVETVALPATTATTDSSAAFIRAVYACPVGIFRMSPDIAGLVQTSNNLARIQFKDGALQVQCLGRSSVDSEKTDLQQAVAAAFESCGAEVKFSGAYPGWTPRPESMLVKFMSDLYAKKFGHPAHVSAVHAGLECGILGTNYPNMQMISFGPNITGAHSPDEQVQISSVQKFWNYFLAALHEIK